MGVLISDPYAGEIVCQKCGFAPKTLQEEGSYPSDQNSTISKKEHIVAGSIIFDLKKDHIKNSVRPDLVASIRRAQKWIHPKKTRKEIEMDRVAVKKAITSYHKAFASSYDRFQLEYDEKEIVQRILNLTCQLGSKIKDDMIYTSIKNYIKQKIEKNQDFTKFFDLETLEIKIRHNRTRPENISGRGVQIGRNRIPYKNTKPTRCNICNIDFGPGNRCLGHKIRYHQSMPYHVYTNPRNNYVSRPAREPEDIIVDASDFRDKKDKRNQELGTCTSCGVQAILSRYVMMERNRRVSRLIARHKGQNGKWKICILTQRIFH
jgi:hypothetical protein